MKKRNQKEQREKQEVIRYYPDKKIGLTQEQIDNRKEQGLVNYDTSVPTKSIKRIIVENTCTLFNLMNLLLAIAVLAVGSYKNVLFILIIILNTLISTIQEIHSKRIVDRLSIVSQTKVKAIRDGEQKQVEINEIVLDDVLKFQTGNQIVTDCTILEGEVEVNESFITGESNLISKKEGDLLLSGSFIVSGSCISKVEHIGEENYTYKISSGAKYIKKVNSEIMKSLNQIVKTVSIVIIPLGLILFFHQMQINDGNLKMSVVSSVAAMIGMIPEGLILLTSTVLAVSVIRLSRNKVLVQELYCIETLARVDTLCLDKTGTITEGKMEVKDIIPISVEKEKMEIMLSALAQYSSDHNSTIEAIRERFKKEVNDRVKNQVPFSSQKKWSGISFEGIGSLVMGAPEFVLKEKVGEYSQMIEKYSCDYRLLVLAISKENFEEKELPKNLEVIGFILILDKIRDEAKTTLEYFKEQGVCLKIISGDNPLTVSKIAKHAGLDHYDDYIDMTKLGQNENLEEIVQKYTIFGRVTPTQKKDLVVALKNMGHTIAMTGDGVNDVLALKEADCSIAMASGSDAARNVSELVLLDSNFEAMPKIVAEGRKTINNIERSASLFLAKTMYATILAILFVFISWPYPFMPIQLSLISVVTIGIPSFALALEPNKERIKGHFLINVISRSMPASITVVMGIILSIILSKVCEFSNRRICKFVYDFNCNDRIYVIMEIVKAI